MSPNPHGAARARPGRADADGARPDGHDERFVPRAKPLRDVPEKEVALYAHLRDLPVHMAECPHASEAYRGEIQEHLHALEEDHPGTRHSIMAGYEELMERQQQRAREAHDVLLPLSMGSDAPYQDPLTQSITE